MESQDTGPDEDEEFLHRGWGWGLGVEEEPVVTVDVGSSDCRHGADRW